MYDPKFRFVILIATFAGFFLFFKIIYDFIFGTHGITFWGYLSGVVQVGSAIAGGFLMVWLGLKLIRMFDKKHNYADANTSFSFPVTLSRFIPDVAAPPLQEAVPHPLESDLIGFLAAFKHMPSDLKNTKSPNVYQKAIQQWQIVKNMPEKAELHRIAALAQYLSLVYAYQEHRSSDLWYKLWRRDTFTFSQKCVPHGGLSAFILSSFPSFNAFGDEKQRRDLLTALKYLDDPAHFPINASPPARDIYETLNKAAHISDAQTPHSDYTIQSTDENHAAFITQTEAFLESTIQNMDWDPANLSASSHGLYLGRGRLILKLGYLTEQLARSLTSDVRTVFHLWDTQPEHPHPAWPYILEVLRKESLLLDILDGTQAQDSLFDLTIDGHRFQHSVLLQVDKSAFPGLYTSLSGASKWQGVLSIAQDKETILADIQTRVAEMDTLLTKIRNDAVCADI